MEGKSGNNYPMLLWLGILVWTSSNILSQTMYIAEHGVTYDPMPMLQSLGPWYAVLLVIEMAAWLGVGAWFTSKLFRKFTPPNVCVGPNCPPV